MRRHYCLTELSLCLVLSFASKGEAATKLPLNVTSFKDLSAQFVINSSKPLITSTNALQFVSEHQDQKGQFHRRMQQYYQGIPLFNGFVIVHSPKGTAFLQGKAADLKMNGTLFQDLSPDLGQKPAHYLTKGQSVLNQFLAYYRDEHIKEKAVKPVIYVDSKTKAHWAYQVSASIEFEDKIPEKPMAIIDAKTKERYLEWNEVKTAWSKVQGLGYGGNEKIGLYQFGKDYPYLDLTRQDATCYLENLDVKVVDLQFKRQPVHTAMSFPCTNALGDLSPVWTGLKRDGYDKINKAYSPSNDALYAGTVIKDLFRAWYKLEVLKTKQGLPRQLVMRVHYSKLYENAFWDGFFMTFGDGGREMYPLVSLGIAAHEIAHGFTEQQSGLIYTRQSGAMNEAFSDMTAQAAEYYTTGTNHWEIGSEVIKENRAIRYMDYPERDGMSISSADAYRDKLDVHYGSGVYNRLFYLLATKPGWNTRKAFDVMVKANADYWIPTETFEGGACGLLKAAADLGYNLDDVKGTLQLVKINFKTCM